MPRAKCWNIEKLKQHYGCYTDHNVAYSIVYMYVQTLYLAFKGPDSYYGSKGLRKVTHESVSGGKVTFQFHYAAGNNNGTSVEDGQVPEIIFYT